MKTSHLMLLCLSFLLTCCTTESPTDTNPFGALYQIMQSGIPPAIVADSLVAIVSYSGCNRNHIFAVRYLLRGSDDAEVWLYKLTPDQMCDMYVEETRKMHLPDVITGRSTIVLITPRNERIVLRSANP